MQAMGVKAFRVIRAARGVLKFGYEPEALAYDRILLELIEHRRAIVTDASGSRRWRG